MRCHNMYLTGASPLSLRGEQRCELLGIRVKIGKEMKKRFLFGENKAHNVTETPSQQTRQPGILTRVIASTLYIATPCQEKNSAFMVPDGKDVHPNRCGPSYPEALFFISLTGPNTDLIDAERRWGFWCTSILSGTTVY